MYRLVEVVPRAGGGLSRKRAGCILFPDVPGAVEGFLRGAAYSTASLVHVVEQQDRLAHQPVLSFEPRDALRQLRFVLAARRPAVRPALALVRPRG